MAAQHPDELLAGAGQTLGAYIEKRWGGPTRLIPPHSLSLVLAPERFLQNNPRRMAWIFVNPSQSVFYIGFDPTVNASSGIPVPGVGGSLILLADEDGETVGIDAFANWTGVPSPAPFVLEITRK